MPNAATRGFAVQVVLYGSIILRIGALFSEKTLSCGPVDRNQTRAKQGPSPPHVPQSVREIQPKPATCMIQFSQVEKRRSHAATKDVREQTTAQ